MKTKEAIERVKARFNKWALDEEDLAALQTLGLVSIESEDERTRKNILALVKKHAVNHERCQMEAYLEKQKEQKPDGKKWLTPGELQRIEQLRYEAGFDAGVRSEVEKQKEQKPAELSEEDKNKIERLAFLVSVAEEKEMISPSESIDLRNFIKSPRHQPKQEWSEEDDENLYNIIEAIKYVFDVSENSKGSRLITWLKSRHPQPKQDVFPSLSEKEIICLKRALDYLRKEHNRYGGEDFTNEIAVLEWLITHPILVSDTHWKPSEEQMRAVFDASERNDKLGSVLRNLYDDLKKL